MNSIKRSKSSVSTLQIVGAVAILMVVLVALAFFLVQPKPEAPPKSTIKYEPAPTEKTKHKENVAEEPFEPLGSLSTKNPTPNPTTLAATTEGEKQEATPYRIFGKVTKAEDGAAIKDVRIKARRRPVPGEAKTDATGGNTGDPREKAREKRRQRMMGNNLVEVGEPGSLVLAVTDQDGHYELKLSKPGIYDIEFVSQGFMPEKATSGEMGENLPEQEINTKLFSGASISGQVRAADTGQGVPEIRVFADRNKEVRTDAQGKYILEGLAPGEYGVSVNLRDTEFVAGKELPYRKVKIADAKDKIKGIDFQVETAGIVWGYITTTDKQPVNGADVLLCTSDSPLSQALNSMVKQAPPLSSRAKEDGYYELRGVPLNQPWRLYVTSNDMAPQLADPFLVTKGQSSVRIDVFMFAGSDVIGVVRSSKGDLVADADVACIPSYTKLMSPVDAPTAFRGAKSDEGGKFSIKQLPPGDYQLFARKKGFKVAVSGYPIYPDGYSNVSVELTLNSVDEGEYTVFGTVVDGIGKGIDGATVKLAGMGGGTFETIERDETTGSGGKFRFEGVSTGYYSLDVRKEGYTPATVRRVRLDEEIQIVLRQTATIRGTVVTKDSGKAPASYTVEAFPLSAAGDGKVDTLGMMGNPSNSMTFSNPDGSFELRVNAGQYRLEARAEGYAPGRMEVNVQTGQVMDGVRLILDDKGGRISGMVVAGDNGNVQGAEVLLIEAASPSEAMMMLTTNQSRQTQQLGADGTFVFENLAPGSFVVVARHPRYATGVSELIELPQGGKRENLRIRLGFGGAIEGYVYREGAVVPGAVVLVAGNGATQNATTDQTGYYKIDGLSTGTFQAMVTEISSGDIGSIYGARGQQVNVTEGQTARCDFGNRSGGRIEGTCVPGPANMLGGRVVLKMPGSNPMPIGSSADISQLMGQSTGINPMGQFTMEDVPQGDWQLDVYYFELGGANPLQVRYVHTQLVTVGQSQVIPLTLNIMNF